MKFLNKQKSTFNIQIKLKSVYKESLLLYIQFLKFFLKNVRRPPRPQHGDNPGFWGEGHCIDIDAQSHNFFGTSRPTVPLIFGPKMH